MKYEEMRAKVDRIAEIRSALRVIDNLKGLHQDGNLQDVKITYFDAFIEETETLKITPELTKVIVDSLDAEAERLRQEEKLLEQ